LVVVLVSVALVDREYNELDWYQLCTLISCQCGKRMRRTINTTQPVACAGMILYFKFLSSKLIMSIRCLLALYLSCSTWKSGWVLLILGCMLISAAHMQKQFITQTAMSRCAKYLHADGSRVILNYMCVSIWF